MAKIILVLGSILIVAILLLAKEVKIDYNDWKCVAGFSETDFLVIKEDNDYYRGYTPDGIFVEYHKALVTECE